MKTVVIGSTNSTSSLTLNSGTGGITAVGVSGITPSGTPIPVFINTSGKLGTGGGGAAVVTKLTGTNGGAILPSSGNINIIGDGSTIVTNGSGNSIAISTLGIVATSFLTDAGTAQPSSGIITVSGGPLALTSGSSVSFGGVGSTVTLNLSDGNSNTILGTLSGNTGLVGIGSQFNSVLGSQSLVNIAGGNSNTCLGALTGGNYTGSESNNILIGYNTAGTTGESNVLRVGGITKSFIAGITGVTVTGTAVLVSATGQLGIAVSSRQFKHNIEDINDKSSHILDLRPVTFAYNNDESETTQYGLIAEEVAEIFPDIVSRNKDGEVESVQYHVLPVLLLNEMKKQNVVIQNLMKRIKTLEEANE